ncbi:MAG TPA: M56 family metallopeptidase, partial [Saprospiraceae bacterium]|nr:M56 family metallopeptidase [Saprospiraceae bacterium]
MIFISSSDLLLNKLIQVISWTLVHSLWQGLLVAAIAGIIIMLTRKSSAAKRYTFLIAVFLLFILSTLITFFFQLKEYSSKLEPDIIINTQSISSSSPSISIDNSSSFYGNIIELLNQNASLIVLLWLLIIAVRSLKLFGSFFAIYNLRRNQLNSPGSYWQSRIQELSVQLGIKQSVHFFYSGLVNVPMLIGYFRPIILFPLCVINNLNNEEVEAILIHELAHIRRNDYLINLLQQFTEIIFFFNPPLLWVSSLISSERENCCDDIVIKYSNKRNYINALVAFEEYNISSPISSLALASKKEYLLQRVKRIIYNNNKSLNVMEKLFLATGLILITLLCFTIKPNAQENAVQNDPKILYQKPIDKDDNKSIPQLPDTIPVITPKEDDPNKFTGSISTPVDGKQYKMEIENNVLTGLSINRINVENDKIKEYQVIADKKLAETRESVSQHRMEEEKAYQLAREMDKIPAIPNIQEQQNDELMHKLIMEKQLSEMNRELAESNKYNEKRIQEMLNSVKALEYEKEMLNYQKLNEGTMRQKELEKINSIRSLDELSSLSQKLKQQAEEMNSLADLSNIDFNQFGNKNFSNTIKELSQLEIEMSKLQAEKSRIIAEMNIVNSDKFRKLTNKAREQADRSRRQV